MPPTGTNSRDPRLAGRDPTAVRDEMRKNAARPLRRLHWTRSQPPSNAPFNFLLITNLNDNVSVPLLTSELSEIGNVRHVHIPTVNGRSAGIASVRLPSIAEPHRFVSKFNGYSLFGNQLCVKRDRHAKQFARLLHQLNNPSNPTNDDSTPPTKDTQADSNSPNWSIASKSDPHLSPPPPAAPPKPHSFPPKSPIAKRPRSHPVPNFPTPNGTANVNSSNNTHSATRNDSRRQFNTPTPINRNAHQNSRPSVPSRERSYEYDSRANPPRSHSQSHKPIPHEISRDRFSWQRRHEAHSPHSLHRHRGHYRNRYQRYDDDTPPRRYRSRGTYSSPERRYKDVYRDRRGYSSPERRPSPSSNEHATRQEHDKYPPARSSLTPVRRPAIVLNGVPSSITPLEILSRFRDFRPERVLRDSQPGVLTLVFSLLSDRENALRDGCFIMKGKHVSPDAILTATDGTSSYSARAPPSPRKPDSDRQRASSHRPPQRSTYDSKREPHSQKHRHSVAGGERGLQGSRSPALGSGRASSDGSHSHREMKAPRSLDEGGQSGVHRKAVNSQKEQIDKSVSRLAECEVTDHEREEKVRENGYLRTPKPPKSVEKAFRDANGEKDPLTGGNDRSAEASVDRKLVEKTASLSRSERCENDENPVNVSKRKSMTEDEVFEEFFRHAVDIVSKQHAELEVKRCSALVAKPVFDYISLRKKEEKVRATQVKTKAVHDAMQRFPSSADAFEEQHFHKVQRSKKKDPRITVTNGFSAEQDSESPRKRRRTRFSDAGGEAKTVVLEHADIRSTVYSVDNKPSRRSSKKRKISCSDDDDSIGNSEPVSRDLRSANVNASERFSPTIRKISNDLSKEDKREEQGGKLDNDIVMDESTDNNVRTADVFSDRQGSSREDKKANSAKEPTVRSKGDESNVTNESTKTSSTSSQNNEESPYEPRKQSAFSMLDKELGKNAPMRSIRSSSLAVVQTDSVVPTLKLRSLHPTVLAPKTPEEKEKKSPVRVEVKQRSKPKKSVTSAKKGSRRILKSSKTKKKSKAGKSVMNSLEKKAKSAASTTSISSGDGQGFVSSIADSLNQAALSADDSKLTKDLSPNGVLTNELEQQKDSTEHDVIQGENSVDFNDDRYEGTCARTFIYCRDQNKNRSRKKLRLEAVAGKSVRSSRQCRQETRLYKKGISQIKPKNDDFINLNSLQQRWKKVQFDRSQIHGMGLYAKEHIETDEFVIEYIGDLVRRTVADLREKEYTRQGMGDSYLFRLDSEMVVDATRRGGIARFINHSCNPNLIARTIAVDGRSTIAFYSKRTINVGEELTYDYKFDYEAEDKKIPCLCNATNCRKYLN